MYFQVFTKKNQQILFNRTRISSAVMFRDSTYHNIPIYIKYVYLHSNAKKNTDSLIVVLQK